MKPMMIITSKKLTPNTNNQKRLFLHHLHHPNNMIKSQQQTLTLSSSSSSSSSILDNIDQDQVIVEEEEEEEERVEQMFEKPLTPSDVGKLNRLVIPKQHAEKYFPLDRVDSSETTALLSFEDESRKSWKFRYSYWNSSQSYVLTKGWSRFVKEKRLHAGDVVSFQRRPLRLQRRLHHRDDREDLGRRFFIRWRRGGSTSPIHDHDNPNNPMLIITTSLVYNNSTTAAAAPPTYLHHQPPLHDQYHHHNHQYTTHHAGEPVVRRRPRGSWKRLRLFGVNLDCHQLDDEPDSEGSSPFGSSFSGQDQTHLVYSQAHGSSTSHV